MEITRREFVKLTLVTGAAIGLAGCGIPPHQALVSQLDMPEYRLPGVARWFATTCQDCEGGCGVSVRVIDGRAKKLEGIPEHPVNHGKVCARGHSSLQAFYNPDRLTAVWQKQGGALSPVKFPLAQSFQNVYKFLGSRLDAAKQNQNRETMLWITKPLSGTRGALLASLAEKVGAKIWVLDFPGAQAERAAMKSLTGKPLLPYHDFRNADYVLNFGSDFLLTGYNSVHDAWGYGEFRRGKERKIRGILVSFAPRVNTTVANSDKWIPVRPGSEGWVALGIGNLLAESKNGKWPKWTSKISLDTISKMTGVPQDVFRRVALRLKESRHPLCVGGAENGAYVNGAWSLYMIAALNYLLSGKIQTVETGELIPLPNQKKVSSAVFVSSREALSGMGSGKFQDVWVFDVNPGYLLPVKLNFETLFAKAKNRVVFTPFMNETAIMADWVLPTQTWLEEWGDRRLEGPYGVNGETKTMYNLQQPVAVLPPDMAGQMSAADILLASVRGTELKKEFPWDTLHDLLKSRFTDESIWENLLQRGGIWDPYPLDWEMYSGGKTHPLYPPQVVESKGKISVGISAWDHVRKFSPDSAVEAKFQGDKQGLILIPFYSPTLGDGSFANRPWMQELPDPVTTTVWTHWIELPIPLAKQLGVTRGDTIRITSDSGSLEGPAYPNPGLHPEAVAVPVGQGHFSYGQYAYNRGANPLAILNSEWQSETDEIAWVSTRVTVRKTGEKGRMTVMDTRMNRLPVEVLNV